MPRLGVKYLMVKYKKPSSATPGKQSGIEESVAVTAGWARIVVKMTFISEGLITMFCSRIRVMNEQLVTTQPILPTLAESDLQHVFRFESHHYIVDLPPQIVRHPQHWKPIHRTIRSLRTILYCHRHGAIVF